MTSESQISSPTVPVYRRTKIVATLGPATESADMIRTLADAGVNVFRLNFSHGDHETLKHIATTIRDVEYDHPSTLAILADLQGPKLRIGKFKEKSITLEIGQSFRFDLDKTEGDSARVNLPHPEVLDVLDEGSLIFLDDGNVRMRILEKGADFVTAEVKAGHKLSNNKGLNVPGAILDIPALTNKDKIDLKVAMDIGADWIAQSFVQTAQDVKEAKDLINAYIEESAQSGKILLKPALMAKIEKPSALDHLSDIIQAVDGIMLARGDLGVEIPPQDVPAAQKRVVRMAREAGKPVIVATQMLESMVHNPRPTRAEASDVATAVYDGADAVMLSAETSVGEYPQKAVEIMAKICRKTENDETYDRIMDTTHPATALDNDGPADPSEALTAAAYYVAQDIEAAFIVTYTMSGSTALRMARQRPDVPILCLTPRLNIARKLALSYGVHAVKIAETLEDFTGPARNAAKVALEHNIGQKGDRFVMTAGIPFGVRGSTNVLRISRIANPPQK